MLRSLVSSSSAGPSLRALAALAALGFGEGPAWAQAAVDLRASEVSFSPGEIQAKDGLRVRGRLERVSGSFMGNVTVEVLFSRDPVADATDRIAHRGPIFFASDRNVTFERIVLAPGLAPGRYHVLLRVNPDGQPPESSAANNVAASTGTVELLGADLEVTALRATPLPLPDGRLAVSGGRLRFEASVANTSTSVSARGFHVAFGIWEQSPSTRVGTQLVLLGPMNIGPGQVRDLTATVAVPRFLDPLSALPFVSVDLFGAVPETSGRNNFRWGSELRILPARPELAAEVVAAPIRGEAGGTLTLTRRVRNLGPAPAADVALAYRLVGIDSAETIPLAETVLASVPAGEEDLATETLELPRDVAPGPYRVELTVDPEAAVPQLSRENDVAVSEPLEIHLADLRIETAQLPSAVLGRSYAALLEARGGALPVTWSRTAGALPRGLALEAEGRVSGVPREAGRFEVTLRATSGAAYVERAVVLGVAREGEPLRVLSERFDPTLAGRPYRGRALHALGGVPPYRWRALGRVPPRVHLEPSGRLEGAPDTPGGYFIEVEVEDALGARATAELELAVVLPANAVRVKPVELPALAVGVEACAETVIRLEAELGLPPFRWSAPAGLPAGLELSEDGALCGSPTRAGRFSLEVRVQDNTGLSDTDSLPLDIGDNPDCDFRTAGLPGAQRDRPYEAQLEASSACRSPRFTRLEGAGELPPGLSLDEEGRVFGRPAEAGGVYAFAVRLESEDGTTRARPFSIAVAPDAALLDAPGGCRCARPAPSVFGLALLPALALIRRRRSSRARIS